MTRKVVTAPDALLAMKEARRWLKQAGSGPDGNQRWLALRGVRRALSRHPYLGVASPELNGHRRVSVSGYCLIYQINPDTGDEQTAGDIQIVAVFGPGQK